MFTKFTKLFRTTRLIFMAEPEIPESTPTGSDDEPTPAQTELTELITKEVAKITTQITVDTRKVDEGKRIATEEGGKMITDNVLDEQEKEAIITLLRQQIGERLELKEKIRILSSVQPWEKLTTEGTALTREGWQKMKAGTEITVSGLTAEQEKYVGLNELLPVEIDAIEAGEKTYTRLAATTERRGGFYYQNPSTKKYEYFSVKNGTTFKIAERHGMPVPPEERVPVEMEEPLAAEPETEPESPYTETAAKEAMQVGTEGAIYDRSVEIPEWLSMDQEEAGVTKREWDKLLREAGQNNENTGRVIDIIQNDPFNWKNPSQFYDVVAKGDWTTLSFNDIAKAKLGMTARQVERTIDESKKSGLERQIDRTDRQITETTGKITEITNHHTDWGKQDSEDQQTWLTRIQEKIGEDETGDAKKLAKLIKKLITKQEQLDQLKAKDAQVRNMEALVAASMQLMDAMAGIEQGTEGVTTRTELEDTRTEGERLAESAFTETKADRKAQRHDMVDYDQERTVARVGRTDALSIKRAGDTAYDMFMQEHKLWTYSTETGERTTAENAEIVTELQKMVSTGIDVVTADPTSELKVIGEGEVTYTHRLLKIADTVGVEVEEATRDTIETGLTEINNRTGKIDKVEKAIKALEGRIARRDAKDKDNATLLEKLQAKKAELAPLQEGLDDMRARVETEKQKVADALKTELTKSGVIESTLTEKGAKTDIIRELIRIGFSRDVDRLETQRYLQACQEEIDQSGTILIRATLQQILAQDPDHKHRPKDYKKWREILEKQEKIPVTMDIKSDRTERMATIGIGGSYNPNTGGFGIGGGFDVPVGDQGTSVGLEGGINEGMPAIGGHVSQVFEVGERVSLSATLDVSTLGIMGVAGITVDLGKDWEIMAAAGGGMLWNIVPVATQTVGIMHGSEQAVERAERRIDIRTGLGEIEKLFQEGNKAAAIEKIKQLPQLQKSVEQITVFANGNEALLDALILGEYAFLKEQVGIQAAKEAVIFPLSGAGVTAVEVGTVPPITLIVPWIKISIKGETRIIPVCSRSEMETKHITEDMVHQAILKNVGAASFGEIVEGRLKTDDFVMVMSADGTHKLAIAPDKRDVLTAEFSREDIDKYNQDAHAMGLHLTPTENAEDNLYKMSFANVDNAFVEIHMDPKAQEHMSLVYGGENVFLSFNTTRQNLIITREEVMLPYNREGKNKVVIFTIQENPLRTAEQIAQDERSYIEFSRDIVKKGKKRYLETTAPVERKKAGSGKGGDNVRSFDEYQTYAREHKDTMEFARTQYTEAFGATIDAFTVEQEKKEDLPEGREGQLIKVADYYVSLGKENKKTMRKHSTLAYKYKDKTPDSKEAYKELLAEVIETWGSQKPKPTPLFGEGAPEPFNEKSGLTDLEASIIVNRLIVESFQQIHGNRDQFQRDLERFFTPMIEEIFTQKTGDENLAKRLAQEFLSRLKLNTLQFKIGDDVPEGMEVYALVGTMGYTGLRGMPNFQGEEKYQVMNMVDLDNASPELKRVVLDIVSPIPEDNEQFLNSRLGAQIGLWSPVLIGIEESKALARHDFNYMNSKGEKAIDIAKKMAHIIREAEVRGQTNVMINGTNVGLNVDLKGGLYERCGNPLFMGTEEITVAGRTITGAAMAELRTKPEAKAALLEFVIGYAIQLKQPPEIPPGRPTPGKRPPGTDDGVGGNEGPEAGTVTEIAPNTDIHWGGANPDDPAPGQ